MSRNSHSALVLLSIVVWSSSLFAQEPAGTPSLLEGAWTHRGPRTVLGSGVDKTVIVKKEGNEWTITYDLTLYPAVNQKGALPTTRREGPYKVTVDDQELVFVKDGHEVRYTFLCDPTRLILPAIVQKRPGEWTFRSETESYSVRCESDPFKVPVGKAEMPGVQKGKGFYSYEEAPRGRLWPRAQYLRFLERSDENGQLCERFRLIFDEYGSPRYEALLSTGERSIQEYQLRVFLGPDKQK